MSELSKALKDDSGRVRDAAALEEALGKWFTDARWTQVIHDELMPFS